MSDGKATFRGITTPALGGAHGSFLLDQSAYDFAEKTSEAAMPVVFAGDVEFSADSEFWPSATSWMSQIRPYRVRNGVHVIPVRGVLHSDLPYSFEGVTVGYDFLQESIRRGAADPDVAAIVLDLNSPGGAVTGCQKTANAIAAAAKIKPVIASVNESACSAAMWIASQCSKIVIEECATIGSIGVLTIHRDISEMLKNQGIRVTGISAGALKQDRVPFKPLSEEAAARIATNVQFLYGRFCAAVAAGRGMTADAVKATEAAIYIGEEGVRAGLADQVGSLEDAIALASSMAAKPRGRAMTNSTTAQADPATTTTAQSQAPAGTVVAPVETTASAVDAPAPVVASAAPAAPAVSDQRERIKSIMTSDEGRANTALAEHLAYSTEMSADDALAVMKAAVPASAAAAQAAAGAEASVQSAAFVAAMTNSANPNIGADAAGGTETQSNVAITIAAVRRRLGQ